MADRYQRPYLDAIAWVEALSGKGFYSADLAEVLKAADRGALTIVMSVLMPLEVLGGTRLERAEGDADRALRAVGRSSIAQVGVTARIVREARQLRLDYRLKSMDALHLASAAAGRADAFLSNDDQVLKLGTYRGVPIRKPTWPGDMGLTNLADV